MLFFPLLEKKVMWPKKREIIFSARKKRQKKIFIVRLSTQFAFHIYSFCSTVTLLSLDDFFFKFFFGVARVDKIAEENFFFGEESVFNGFMVATTQLLIMELVIPPLIQRKRKKKRRRGKKVH